MHLLGKVLEDAWSSVRHDDPAWVAQRPNSRSLAPRLKDWTRLSALPATCLRVALRKQLPAAVHVSCAWVAVKASFLFFSFFSFHF